MNEFTDHIKQKIKLLVETITKRSIGNQCPKGFCFSTSFALSVYFNSQEIRNFISVGKMNNTVHFWLNLIDYDDIIIDATIKQFDKNQDIYIGNISDNKTTEQYKPKCISFNDWIDLYEIWCNPEFD